MRFLKEKPPSRLTHTVIDFEFADDDDQNPEASTQHLVWVDQKRERTEGCVLFQDGKWPQLARGSRNRRG